MKDEASCNASVVGAVNERAPGERAHFSVTDGLRKLETVYGVQLAPLFEHGSLQVKVYAPRVAILERPTRATRFMSSRVARAFSMMELRGGSFRPAI
ncbi:MAG TPA: hypothetical protein VKE91_04100 [Blastocatellia bacterium]|nr:hypothetical protein [Blastocatellia bacterium]